MTDVRLISVVGYQDAGKTQVVEALVAGLRRGGAGVGVIKHDGHADSPDHPTDWEKRGSDTDRVARAGARWTMIASRRGWMLHDWVSADTNVFDWIRTMLGAIASTGAQLDWLVVEGAKRSPLPKVLVARDLNQLRPLLDSVGAGAIAVCWTGDIVRDERVQLSQFHLSDIGDLIRHLTTQPLIWRES
ncbi:molybdopterin-guanine dinucleotide biosynthesis protein B [Alicyclobacillus suci]|uniref:molybdopterin-guanine dinucleotide biosynthesis protein B n=1 Tax=Alicyclobacillus suci TaxID=2816080 RepID=UPI001A8D5402|nr:molybdopterin-guanine dinucleotide biosynthesis protein MobB [Alicyclobacillus suci]